jgi:hypothetical protein
MLDHGEERRMPDHPDRPAEALAHGPAKPDDIKRVRRDVDEAEARSVREEEVAAARHRQRVSNRAAEHEKDART